MKTTYKKLMAAMIMMMAACAFFFIGCNKENPELDTPFVNVDQSIVNAPAGGGELTLTVTANRPWKLTDNMSDEKWLIADKTEGDGDAVITLTVAPNTGVTREADLRIATSTVYVDVRITQPGDIATEVIYFETVGTMPASTTTAMPQWPSVSEYTGWNTSGSGAANVTYTAEGQGASARGNQASGTYTGASKSGNVMISSNATTSGGFLINGIDPMGMTNMDLSFGTNVTSTILTLFYNTGGTEWTPVPFEKTAEGWDLVSVSFTIPEGSSVLNLKYTAFNYTFGSRLDDIKLVGSSGAPATGDLRLSTSSLSFVAGGEQKSFTVTSTSAWTVTPSETWLTVSPTNGNGNAPVNVTAQANTGAQRTANIIVATGEESKTVAVTQAAAESSASAIYYENVGATTVTSNTNLSAFSGWSKEGTGGSGVTYSGSSGITIRRSNASSEYEGVSGGNNVFFGTGAPNNFTVSGIELQDVTNITLSFGVSKVKGGSESDNNTWKNFTDGDFTVSYSPDDAQWYPINLELTSTPQEGSSTIWALASAEISTTGISSLSLKWECTIASVVRIDDIKVVQSSSTPDNFLTLSTASASFTDAAGTQTVTVSSNTEWMAAVSPGDTWCTLSTGSGTNNGSFTVNVTANTGTTARAATITVKTNDNAISQTFAVTQAAAPAGPELEVNPAALSFVVAGESKTFTITSNTAWTVTPDEAASWCTVTPPLTGSDNATVNVTAQANSGAARSATITVSGTDVADKEIGVTQAGAGGGGGSAFAKTEWDFVSAISAVSAITSMDATTGSGTLTTTAGTATGTFATATNKSIWTGNWLEDGSVAKAWNMEIPVSGFTGGTLKVSFGAYGTATGPRDWAVEWSANGTDWSTPTAAQTYTASTVTTNTYEKSIQPTGITDKLYIRLHVVSEISIRAGTGTSAADDKFAVGGNARLMTKLTIEEE